MKKKDGAQQLHSYVRATQKQGARLVPTAPVRTPKEEKRRHAEIQRDLKKTSN